MKNHLKKSHYHADMLSVEEARQRIISKFHILDKEDSSILDTLGQVIAEDIYSKVSVPPLDNSAMDGFALKNEDIVSASETNVVYLNVVETIEAGRIPKKKILKGEASRIMTGAPIPEGATTVVPFEETDENQQKESNITKIGIKLKTEKFENIRTAGEDIKSGEKILSKGDIVSSSVIGISASIGMDKIPVFRRPNIGVLSTGNELLSPGDKIQPGKIFDSNTYTISSLIKSYGAIPIIEKFSKDNVIEIESKIKKFENIDLIVTSAGVSKGDYDVVKEIMENKGEINFWSVNMRPAKPLAFGYVIVKNKQIPFIGLPGNPVSAMIALDKFARFAINKMMGKPFLDRPVIKAKLDSDIINYDDRRFYARVYVYRNSENIICARPLENQSSGVLTSMHYANGLGICPSSINKLYKDEIIDVEMFNWSENITEIINPKKDI